MIFSELYSAYYNAVAAILKQATEHPVDKTELRKIVENNAFGESVLNIEAAISQKRWQLINKDGTTDIKNIPTMPLTNLQKRWLKSIYSDPRIKLFTDDTLDFGDIEPLFIPEDIIVFDKYSDGDNYEDKKYIKNFRTILNAIKNKNPVYIAFLNRHGSMINKVVMPKTLEYSEKDDKFRLVCMSSKKRYVINLARIFECKIYKKDFHYVKSGKTEDNTQTAEFLLFDERNALERVLLHFAHFKKQAEKTEENTYKVTLYYDKDDETELLIRILSFGPMIKVIGPQNFTDLIKERLIMQKSCEN